MTKREFAKIFPLYGIEQDCILSRKGDVTVCYRLSLPELFSSSGEDYEALHQMWIKAMKVLQPGTIYHQQDWFLETSYQPRFGEEQTLLSRSSERFFNERPFLRHQCYVMLTMRAGEKRVSSSLRSGLLKRHAGALSLPEEKEVDAFLESVGQFEQIVNDSRLVRLTRLLNRDLASTASRIGLPERYCFLQSSDTPRVEDIQLKPDLRIGHRYCQLFSLSDAEDLPGFCGPRSNYEKYSTDKTRFSIGFASPVGGLLFCNHLYNQYIFIEDSAKMLKAMEAKRLRLQSLSMYSRENTISRDSVNDFLNEAIAQQRLPVKAHFNVLAWTDEKEKLPELVNRVSSALASMEVTPKRETTGAAQIWWAGMPGNEGDFPMNDTFDTFVEPAVCFLNTEGESRSSCSPVGIRLGDRLTGKPLHVDISDEPVEKGVCTNRNKFILGPSGSGKSFFTNHMVRTYYEQGTHVVLVDVGHSYKGLCDLVQGYYFTYSETEPIRFNPFHVGEGDILDTEKKESIKTLLLALWKKDNETYKRSEYVALSNALQEFFAYLNRHPEVFACFNSFYEFLRQEFVVLLREDGVKEKDFDVGNFLYVLRPYYKGGEFDYLLNATEDLDLLSQRFIVFELDNIKDHPILFPVVTIIIMEVFVSKMRKLKGIRKMILIEEAWKAIAREGMAEYIRYLFKTVRKFYGEAVVVTQEVEDILSSPVVKGTIINNSDCKILLDQSKYQNKFDDIQQLLGLTEKEKTLVLSINKANEPGKKYKEVFISLGGTLSRVYRTEVSPEEYLAYTTEEKEKMRVQDYARKYGSLSLGIRHLANELRENEKA